MTVNSEHMVDEAIQEASVLYSDKRHNATIPHVDLTTRKIYGAEPDTHKYFHEEGHLKFNDDFSKWVLANQTLTGIWMLTMSLGMIIWTVALASISLLILIMKFYMYMYEEHWCDNYADFKMEELKNG